MGSEVNLNLLRFSREDLVFEIFGELLGPLVIVRRDREIFFKSAAFDELAGTGAEERHLRCNLLILPDISGCCLDAVASYPKGVRHGLWNLKRDDGTLVPVHVRWRPISVGSRMSLLAIHFERLPGHPSFIAKGFFESLWRAAGGGQSYWDRVLAYLERNAGVKRGLLVEASGNRVELRAQGKFDDDEVEQIRRILQQTGARTQDVFLPAKEHGEVISVVSAQQSGDRKLALAFQTVGGEVTPDLVDIALAALSAVDSDQGDQAEAVQAQELDLRALVASLSPAEAEVLEMVVEGLTDKEIARRRGVSPWTVKNQVKSILHKAGTHRRIDLARRLR